MPAPHLSPATPTTKRVEILPSPTKTASPRKSYNAAGELLKNLHLHGGSTVNGRTYTLDATGRRTAEVRGGDLTVTSSYGYDATNQVVSANYGSPLAYAYDPMGNRTSANVASQGGTNTTYTSNSANQYTSITGLTPISHDANGNLLQQNDVIYSWDSERGHCSRIHAV
mgnify:CR=1 FL=1